MNIGLNNAVDPQARGGKLLPVQAVYVALFRMPVLARTRPF